MCELCRGTQFLKKKFLKSILVGPMNNARDPQKKRRRAFCCFSSQSKPNLNSKNSKHSYDAFSTIQSNALICIVAVSSEAVTDSITEHMRKF